MKIHCKLDYRKYLLRFTIKQKQKRDPKKNKMELALPTATSRVDVATYWTRCCPKNSGFFSVPFYFQLFQIFEFYLKAHS